MADSEAQPNHATDNTNPSKYCNHFLFKAIIVTIFLVLLPPFPSQSPEPINQTRTWEIVQLIFVGIAVSYGLFSKKSDEISLDKENGSSPTSPSKFDNAQSYVFDDESEDSSVFSDDNNSNSNSNSNKVFQTWNQYHRGETQSHILEENLKSISVKTSKVGEKPLLLPVRSLKSRVAEADLLEETSNNKSDPKRFSGKLMEEKLVENLVLPSPTTWRSRSGRMEIKEESPPLFSSSSKTEDSVFSSQSFRSYSSPSRAPGFSSQRKKTSAPPPPPPHFWSRMKKKTKKQKKRLIMETIIPQDEKWIKHYCSSQKLLLVGEGDFSFSAALATAFGFDASNMIATSLNSYEFLAANYANALSNIYELKRRGCEVIHGVDVKNMAHHPLLRRLTFDRIVFNFPFVSLPKKSRTPKLLRHQALVRAFLENAVEMIGRRGEIHITHKTNGFHREWDIPGLALEQGLRLFKTDDFWLEDYPGYNTKRGFGGDDNFNCYPSQTYMFELDT